MRTFLCLLGSACCLALNLSAQNSSDVQRWEARAAQVQIVRDTYGVPHVYAKTDADAVFGFLYAQCEDNFERIERNYLEMLGRRAEMEGPSALYDDLLMRLIADTADAKKDFARSPEWLKKLLVAHADGINYFLYKHPEVRPVVLKKFEPWFHLMYTDGSVSATSTGGATTADLRQFYGPQIKNQLSAVHPMPMDALASLEKQARHEDELDLRGSNGFAIGRTKSSSGNAMLYINPHVPFYFRCEGQMTSQEGLQVYGAATWGQFFIYQGFNENCGWMHTSGYTDVADLYLEKVRATEKGWVYAYEQTQRPVRSKAITLQYKDKEGLKSVQFTGYYTHHGPVVGERNGQWLALKEYNRSLKALVQSWLTTKANGLAAYTEAMRGLSNTTNNTVYADKAGNIAYWHGNFVPKRNPKYNWALPVDGSIAATEWMGVHPLESTVRIVNPATGFIQNCNATPFTASGKSSPRRSQYPNYMAPDGQNARGLNAARLLDRPDKLSLEQLVAVGYDRYMAAFDLLLPNLFKAWNEAPNGPLKDATADAIQVLKGWDKKVDTGSVATTLAIEWAQRMSTQLPRKPTREENTEVVGFFKELSAVVAGDKQLSLLQETTEQLKSKYGYWQVSWGTMNRYQRLQGQFDQVFDDKAPSLAVPMASSRWGTLPAFESRTYQGSKGRYGFSGNSFVAAVEFGKKLKAMSIVTGGQSFDPASPHFTDQALGFIQGQFKPVFFYRDEVLAHQEKAYRPGQ